MRIRKYDYVKSNVTLEQEEAGGIHPYHELLYIASGEVALRWMGFVYNAEAPALFLLAPNTPHWLVITSAQCSFGYIELDMQPDDFFPSLDKIIRWNEVQCHADRKLALVELVYRTSLSVWETLRSLSYTKSIATQIAVLDTQKILLIISSFLDKETKVYLGERMSSEEKIHGLMRFMESGYKQNITLINLASYLHLNPSYLARLFRRVTGMTPLGYLQELRMNAATSFLSTTTMSVREIAEAVGYQSIHYFSRIFKQKIGISPTQWRNEQQSGRTVK